MRPDKRLILVALLLAVVLPAMSLDFGLVMDDHYLVSRLERPQEALLSDPDLYTFANGDPVEMGRAIAEGPLPWWTDPKLQLRFFRPLSSALLRLDHALFGGFVVGWHAHAILWNVLLVAAVGWTLRRVLPARVAAIAILLFAVEESRLLPVVWLANRHALVSSAIGACAVALHLAGRGGAGSGTRVLSVVALALAFAGGEMGLQAVAMLVAWEWLGADDARRTRAWALAPAIVVTAIWASIYAYGGYGARASDLYIDPLRQPVAFAAAVPERLLVLIASAVVGISADPAAFSAATGVVLAGIGLLGALGAGILLRRTSGGLLWVVVGSIAALVPATATAPSDRQVGLAAMGGVAVVASLLHAALEARGSESGALEGPSSQNRHTRRALRFLAPPIVLLHILLPIAAWIALPRFVFLPMAEAVAVAAASGDLADCGGRRLVLLSAGFGASVMGFDTRAASGEPMPAAWWTISRAHHDLRVTRPSADVLEVAVLGGELFELPMDYLERSASSPLPIGSLYQLDGLEVKVLAAGPGGSPTRLSLRFDGSPDGDRYRIVAWRDGELRKVTLPAVGAAVVVPWERDPMDM